MESKPKKSKPRAKKMPGKVTRPRKAKPSPSLPEPIEINAAQPTSSPMADQDNGGLLSGINSLFSSQGSQPSASQPASAKDSSAFSMSNSEPLSPESERLLHAVPNVIGEAEELGAPGDVQEQDPIAALMAQVAFEPQDVQDVIEEFFDWLAERFESDHWKLTERQGRMLGRPAAQLLNSMWLKLQNYIPDILARWCEDTPGATAFILACGIVVAPRVAKQVTLSKARIKAKPLVTDQPKPQPIRASENPRVGIVIE